MSKQESLNFLQSCIEKVKNATDCDIQFYKDVYKKDCTFASEISDFEFVFPIAECGVKYEIKDTFEVAICEQNIKESEKKQYSFLGINSVNQQNNDNLPYAA